MSIKFLVLGGGGIWVFWGGGECQFYFYGREDSSDFLTQTFQAPSELSGTGDSQRDSRESIRANHSQWKPLFLQRVRPIRTNHSNFRFVRITRFARFVRIDSRESRH